MGKIYKLSLLNESKLNKLMKPVVFCVSEEKALLYTKGFSILSINELLAKELLNYNNIQRNNMVIDVLNKIIELNNKPLLVKDFEMLFNPDYQMDVLVFMLASRKELSILWWRNM